MYTKYLPQRANFGKDSSYEYAYIFGSKSVVHFQTRCHLKFFLPYGSMLAKKKKQKMAKIQNLKFR